MEEQKNAELPYERFMRFGAQNLTDAELLAIILRTGTRQVSALELGKRILEQAGDLNGLRSMSRERLMAIKGIGEVKAVKLKSLAELSGRMAREYAKNRLSFQAPSSVAAYYMERLRHEKRETVFLVLLDSKGRLLREVTVSTGTVNASLVSPREVFLEALKAEAVGMVLLHNHPSGDPSPSEEDKSITRRIRQGAELLDLTLLDHLIIGDCRYFSFLEAGLL